MRRVDVTSPAYIRECEAKRIGYLYRDALKEAVSNVEDQIEVLAIYRIYMTDVAAVGWVDRNARTFTTEHAKILKPYYEKYDKEFKVTSIEEVIKYVTKADPETSYYKISRQIIIDKNYKIQHKREIERITDEITRSAIIRETHAHAFFTIPPGSFGERYHFTNLSLVNSALSNIRLTVNESEILESVITLLVNKTSIKEIYNVDMNNLYSHQGGGVIHIHVKPNEHYWSFENAKD
jgi:hypothetical protein